MSTPRYFKPGIEGGVFYLSLSGQADIEIPSYGIVVNDPEVLNVLDNHPLNGHRNGFIEVGSLGGTSKVADNNDSSRDDESLPDNASISDTKKYIEDKELSDPQIIELTEGDNRVGIQKIHDAAKSRLQEVGGSGSKAGGSGQGAETQSNNEEIIVEEVSNINQLKDYLEAETDVDGDFSTPEAIFAAAKKLDPPRVFPNLNAGG